MAWVKGQSGNPKGPANKLEHGGKSLRELARGYTKEAIKTLANAMREGETTAVKVQAASHLLDRGWGRPTQMIAGDEDGAPIKMEHITDAADAFTRAIAGLATRAGTERADGGVVH